MHPFMFCVQISDETYRRAAKLAAVEEIHLVPVEDEDFEKLRARVDAVLFNAMRAGLRELEASPPARR